MSRGKANIRFRSSRRRLRILLCDSGGRIRNLRFDFLSADFFRLSDGKNVKLSRVLEFNHFVESVPFISIFSSLDDFELFLPPGINQRNLQNATGMQKENLYKFVEIFENTTKM